MKTLHTLLEAFKTVKENHPQINGYDYGPLDEVDIAKKGATDYPLLYVETKGVTLDVGVASFEFDIIVASTINEDMSDRSETQSQLLAVIHDVVNEFHHAFASQSSVTETMPDYTLELPVSCIPFTQRFDNHLTGWGTTIELQVNNDNSLCLKPS